jgi:hypothetical protein
MFLLSLNFLIYFIHILTSVARIYEKLRVRLGNARRERENPEKTPSRRIDAVRAEPVFLLERRA